MVLLKVIQKPSSWAFCIRNSLGDLIYATANTMFHNTSLGVEAKSIEKTIEYCIQHHYLPLIIETDSWTMKQILYGESKVPWNISMEVRRINEGMRLG